MLMLAVLVAPVLALRDLSDEYPALACKLPSLSDAAVSKFCEHNEAACTRQSRDVVKAAKDVVGMVCKDTSDHDGHVVQQDIHTEPTKISSPSASLAYTTQTTMDDIDRNSMSKVYPTSIITETEIVLPKSAPTIPVDQSTTTGYLLPFTTPAEFDASVKASLDASLFASGSSTWKFQTATPEKTRVPAVPVGNGSSKGTGSSYGPVNMLMGVFVSFAILLAS